MSALEDAIRDTLRAEATSLGEVHPLRLPPAGASGRAQPAGRVGRTGWLRSWRGPALAVALVLLVAATLVTLKSVQDRHPVPASPSGVVGPAGTPRYYLAFGGIQGAGTSRGLGIIAGDEQTGRILGSFLLGQGDNVLSGGLGAGAADDRTFVVTGAVGRTSPSAPPVIGSHRWFLLHLVPGSARPVRVSKLAVKAPPDGHATAIALSGDGTELAVAWDTSKDSGPVARKDAPKNISRSITLSIYSVATGRLQHSWSATISTSFEAGLPISDLSWVGDTAVGFAVIDNPQVREEVRVLDLSAARTDLLTASHVVWSQYVPGPRGDVYQEDTPRACGTPTLTGNGQAVVCGNSIYSADDKRLTAVWLAYPLATPTRPRVIGSVLQPKDVSSVSPVSVDWANASGTELIGSWFSVVVTFPGGVKSSSSTGFRGFVGAGTVRQFPRIHDPKVIW